MATRPEILRALRSGAISLDEAEQRLKAAGQSEAPRAEMPAPAAPAGPMPGRADAPRKRGPIAVIGMSGRYPGAPDLERFWMNLAQGRCSIREIPASRWDVRPFFKPLPVQKGKVYCKWLGMLEDADRFDPLFFNIAPSEAEVMDPQQRIFLEEAYGALEDAGYAGPALSDKRCGVYLGIMSSSEYVAMLHDRGLDAVNPTGNSLAIAAARLSYFLNLKGPAIALDTACSSSLVAAHLACQALLAKEIDAAVVGGVTLYLSPTSYLGMCAAGMLSPDGACHVFDDDANGFVPGEGAGALVLKRLEDAEADGDAIHGVIIGSGINQDGRTNGITAPSTSSQMALEREVYDACGLDPGDVSYVEMHGTGTKLGDPVELEALSTVFKERTAKRRFCAIGSVKSNIGHTSAAAGVASLQKVLLGLRHAEIPPTLHYRKPNRHFDFQDSPFYVNTAHKPWPAAPGAPRRACVSSFGFSGTNAHLVVEEYRPKARGARAPAGPFLFAFSAKSEERLKHQAERLCAFVESSKALDLGDLAFTLQTGREALEHRLAFLAQTREEVAQALRGIAQGKPPPTILVGRARRKAEELSLLEDEDVDALLGAWLEKKRLSKVARLWVQGVDVDWKRLYADSRPRRLHLPTSPLARERCWIPEAAPFSAESTSPSAAAALHPLVHQNVSDLFEQRYSAAFTGREAFLEDHVVQGSRVMPGAALLEMARAAVAKAWRAGDRLRLERVAWTAPLVMGDRGARVEIRLMPRDAGTIEFEISSRPAEGDGSPRVHGRGRARLGSSGEPPTLDIPALRASCARRVSSAEECYAAFEAMGFRYGPSHRGLEVLYAGDGRALAALRPLPAASGEAEPLLLPPGVLDSAFQAVLGVAQEREDRRGLALPCALDALEVFGSCAGARWAFVQPVAPPANPTNGERGYDIDLCEEGGRLCAQMRGFTVRSIENGRAALGESAAAKPSSPAGAIERAAMLTPVWEAVRLEPAVCGVQPGARAVVVGAGEARLRAVQQALAGASGFELRPEETEGSLAARLEALGRIDHLVWLAPEEQVPFLAGDELIEAQEKGVLPLFRLIKALLRAGYGARPLEWTAVTAATQRVFPGEIVEPAHAGVHGLMGSLAKEYPRWRVRLVDLEEPGEFPVAEILSLPTDASGKPLARRSGEWHRRRLAIAQVQQTARSPYRKKGVYVVVGGAGGIGEVWSEFMIRTTQASVVWLGRRTLDSAIQAKIDRLAALGPAPVYLKADATNRAELEAAYQDIKQKFARVHGVVHAAIDLKDQSFATMEEGAFKAGLAAKADVSVRLARLFRNDALDFALFFSSAQSFLNAAGQSNYAAGCAFEDAIAQRLAREWPCAVRVMNWGYWGSHGAVAGSAYRERMARAGIGSIEPAEAMEALEALLAGPLEQVAFVRAARPERLEEVDARQVVEAYPEAMAPVLERIRGAAERSDGAAVAALATSRRAKTDGLLQALLGAQLAAIGADEESLRSGAAARLVSSESHRRWLQESAVLLGMDRPGASPLLRGTGAEAAWKEWERHRDEESRDPDRGAEMRLLDATLKALPDILTGKRLATDILFPGSSFERVEGIYRDNAVADYFNNALAESVAAWIGLRVEAQPEAKLRILEIGAGTGGTTAAVLEKLGPWKANLGEYCFTDLSAAFLARAEEVWGTQHPYLRTRRLDAELSPDAQGLETGAYDIAIAANALHATRSIREALRNTKAALKRNGLLALSEISQKTLFLHLTVGLLEGWWRCEDAALRVSGCPALRAETWAKVLAQEGFGPVVLPARTAKEAGQQVILAESDGVVRRRRSTSPEPAVPREGGDRSLATGTASEASPRRPPEVDGSVPRAAPSDGEGGVARAEEHVRATILDRLAKSLKVSADALDGDDAFANYGVDSISGVQLIQSLNEALGIELTATDLFDHGSVNRLTAHIASRLEPKPTPPGRTTAAEAAISPEAPKEAPTAVAAPAPAPPRELRPLLERPPLETRWNGKSSEHQGRRPREPIAVIGMSGRFAGSRDLDELWEHLAKGDDLVTEVSRWDLSRLYSAGAEYCRHGSFLEEIDSFDPLFFKISAQEARFMDPQQRLFLEEAWKALEDAGYAGACAAGMACGVYVGCSGGDYESLLPAERPAQAFWGNAGSVIPARIAYHLDLQGPAVAVDTACSSSLVAVHLACQGLWSGEIRMALAGGVFAQATPRFYRWAQRAGMLSPSGRCHAFDERADGFVPGEGVGAVVLKRLDDALADGDSIHAVIRASGINQDGATNGITAPSAQSQERLERQVYEAFAVDPGQIQLVEAHGTGTKLGDPIEFEALTRAFRSFTDKRGTCALGSIKTNLGHAATAAGIAGLLKVLLSLRHRQIPPSLHLRKANPRIRFEDSPFYVNTALRSWDVERGELRRAAVSSFGFSGTNAHLVVEEGPAPSRAPVARASFLLAFSARSPEQLRDLAERLAARCAKDPDLDLWGASQTLLLGRRHHDCRLAFVAADRRELVGQLSSWLSSGSAARAFAGDASQVDDQECRRQSERGARSLRRCTASAGPGEYREQLSAAAECFARGGALDFDALFEGERRGRLALPTYPFAKERYWAPRREASPAISGAPERSEEMRLHPLVGRNVSTLREQRFATRLTARDFFVGQHRIDGRAILPGVAFLEMARAAGALAAERAVVGVRDLAWLKPVVVAEEGLEVSIALEPEEGEGVLGFEVTSTGASGERDLHARGRLILDGGGEEAPREERLDLGAIRARCQRRLSARDCYDRLESAGLHLGPALRALQELEIGSAEVLASLELPRELEACAGEFLLHPALMDGALQAGIGLQLASDRDLSLYVPYALGEVAIAGAPPRRGYAHVILSGDDRGRRADVRIADETGRVVVWMKDLAARPVAAGAEAMPGAAEASEAESPATARFERVWEAEALGAERAASRRAVIAFDESGAVFDALSAAFDRGEQRVIRAGFEIKAEAEADFDRLLGGVAVPLDRLTLVFAGSSAGEPSRRSGELGAAFAARAQEVVSRLLVAIRGAKRRFPGAQIDIVYFVPTTEGVASPYHAAASGFLRAAGREWTGVACKLVELPEREGGLTPEAVRWAADEVRAGAEGFAEISYSAGRRQRAAWKEILRSPEPVAHEPWRARGTYLITGGLGGLGLMLAQHLARKASARLVLCGRSALDQAGSARLRELEALGAQSLYVQADVSRAEDVHRLIARAKERFGSLHGVLHVAGVTRDSLVATKAIEDMEAVLAPKVLGTIQLDEATRSEPLDFFLSFSSLAAALGNVGQTDYAYANAFMDFYAQHRSALAQRKLRSGRTISIDWPVWNGGGMRLSERAIESMRAATGLAPLEPREGLLALEEILASSAEGRVLVLHGERRRFGQLLAGPSPAEIEPGTKMPSSSPERSLPPLRERRGGRGVRNRSAPISDFRPGLELGIAGSPVDAGRRAPRAEGNTADAVQGEVVRLAAQIAGIEEQKISPDKSLVDFGFDSLAFAELADKLNDRFGLSLSPALFFEFPSVRKLVAHLREAWGARLEREPEPQAAAPVPRAATPRKPQRVARPRLAETAGERESGREPEPVAIIGIGGAMPQSEDLAEFWDHLEAGRDLITEVPRERWEAAGFAAALAHAGEDPRTLWGGFLKEVDKFDALFFGISPREAELMDPQHRIFLETVWAAVEDAGYRMSDLAGSRTGLFVGASTADYAEIVRSSGAAVEGHMATGLAPSVLANRISYLFDFHGPSEPVDTACSSALVALHRAAQAVAAGDCELAIAGGVNALLTPTAFVSFLKAGMLSPDGRCKTFDKRANGYVRGEGAGAVLLKPLRRAVKDGDPIYGVVRGSAINHGGRASSLTAPNVAAQAAVLIEAYERSGIDPATVGYIEAHGTGTALGDPIEVDGLQRAFKALFERRGRAPTVGSCGLGSVKTNVGHLEAAAGMAGLFKVLLAMKHRTLPPSLHFEELNPHIHLEGSPFYVVQQRRPWEPPLGSDGRALPRRAGVSSFGFGGANAHVVLEEYQGPAPSRAESSSQLIVLSAKSRERLRAYAAKLLRHLDRVGVHSAPDGAEPQADALDLEALAFTLQTGREPLEHRLAVVATSPAQLRARLEGFCEGRQEDGVHHGDDAQTRASASRFDAAEERETCAARATRERKLEELAPLWASGASVDFGPLHREPMPRRLSLPTYPFARDRCWLELPGQAASMARRGPTIPVGAPGDGDGPWRARLAAAGERRREVLEAYLCEQVASMLKLSGEHKLDPKRPLIAMGLDSLMALQLKKRIQSQLELDLSLLKLLGGESAAELAGRIADHLAGKRDPGTPESDGGAAIPFDDQREEVLEGVL
jgi:rhizoxin synthesis polyketide synthase/nonribosomal peptide synthetase RhiB